MELILLNQNRDYYLYILDFDNTIYYNPSNDFSNKIDKDNIIPATEFGFIFNQYLFKYYLITGRNPNQQDYIEHCLQDKGYSFDNIITFDIDNRDKLSYNEFMFQYIEWKYREAQKLICNNSYKAIYIFDDNKQVLQPFTNLITSNNIKCIHITLLMDTTYTVKNIYIKKRLL